MDQGCTAAFGGSLATVFGLLLAGRVLQIWQIFAAAKKFLYSSSFWQHSSFFTNADCSVKFSRQEENQDQGLVSSRIRINLLEPVNQKRTLQGKGTVLLEPDQVKDVFISRTGPEDYFSRKSSQGRLQSSRIEDCQGLLHFSVCSLLPRTPFFNRIGVKDTFLHQDFSQGHLSSSGLESRTTLIIRIIKGLSRGSEKRISGVKDFSRTGLFAG